MNSILLSSLRTLLLGNPDPKGAEVLPYLRTSLEDFGFQDIPDLTYSGGLLHVVYNPTEFLRLLRIVIEGVGKYAATDFFSISAGVIKRTQTLATDNPYPMLFWIEHQQELDRLHIDFVESLWLTVTTDPLRYQLLHPDDPATKKLKANLGKLILQLRD